MEGVYSRRRYWEPRENLGNAMDLVERFEEDMEKS